MIFILFTIILACQGCTSRTTSVQFRAEQAMNVDSTHRSMPVLVSLYSLETSENFFEGDISSHLKQQFILLPGQVKTIKLKWSMLPNYLGVYADFNKKSKAIKKISLSMQPKYFQRGLVHKVQVDKNQLHYLGKGIRYVS